MSVRFKYQVKISSVLCLILLLISTFFTTTTIFASPGSSYNSAIAGGLGHSIALKNDGTVWIWGDNSVGQLGDGTITYSVAPVKVSGLSDVIAIASGKNHTIVLKKNGTVWTWGNNDKGQLGDGTNNNYRVAPVQVSGLSGVIAIAGGDSHTIALKNDGTVWTWGNNDKGQLGDGTKNNYRVAPVQVSGLSGVIAIAGGESHTIALKNDGTVWTWGDNSFGQLGDGTKTTSLAPVQVSGGLSGVIAIASGAFHTIALKNDGTVWTWGYNNNGELGDGTNKDKWLPVQVSGFSGVIAIASGEFHSIALKNDGTVWTWGLNTEGILGDGTDKDKWLPVQTGLNGVSAIAGGAFHTIALTHGGTVWTLGYNRYGQLGDWTKTNSSTPVQVRVKFDITTPITALSISSMTASSVTLTWPTETVGSSITVEQSSDGGLTWAFSTTMAANASTSTATGLSPNTAYQFRLSVTSGGIMSKSNVVSVTTNAAPIPNFTITAKTTNSATFSWTAVPDAASLNFEQSTDGGTTWSPSTTGTIAANASTTTATGLSPNTTYQFRLIVMGGGNAGTSNVVSVTTNASPIPNFTITAKTTNSATFSWTAVPDAASLKIEQSTDGGTTWSPSTTGTIAVNASTTTATGLLPNTAYQFRLIITSKAVRFEAESIVDTIAPLTKYHFDPIYETSSSGKRYIKGYSTSLRATDNVSGSGVKTTQYRINGDTWITYTAPFTFYAGITHTVEFFSTDNAGNVENPINLMDFDKGKFIGAGKF